MTAKKVGNLAYTHVRLVAECSAPGARKMICSYFCEIVQYSSFLSGFSEIHVNQDYQ